MIKDDRIIKALMYEDIVEKLAKIKGITLDESKEQIAKMSFLEYKNIIEASADIVPPSGQPLSPQNVNQPAAKAPDKADPDSLPEPSSLSATPRTPNVPAQPGQPTTPAGSSTPTAQTAGMTQPTANNASGMQQKLAAMPQAQLQRLMQLAGIKENCSAGASGVSGIAIAPTAMGSMKTRQPTEEGALKKEYVPKNPAKTIVGDTKPNQASGQLSANLAASGKKSAGRTNNGMKK